MNILIQKYIDEIFQNIAINFNQNICSINNSLQQNIQWNKAYHTINSKPIITDYTEQFLKYKFLDNLLPIRGFNSAISVSSFIEKIKDIVKLNKTEIIIHLYCNYDDDNSENYNYIGNLQFLIITSLSNIYYYEGRISGPYVDCLGSYYPRPELKQPNWDIRRITNNIKLDDIVMEIIQMILVNVNLKSYSKNQWITAHKSYYDGSNLNAIIKLTEFLFHINKNSIELSIPDEILNKQTDQLHNLITQEKHIDNLKNEIELLENKLKQLIPSEKQCKLCMGLINNSVVCVPCGCQMKSCEECCNDLTECINCNSHINNITIIKN